jgi:hypothetical protein
MLSVCWSGSSSSPSSNTPTASPRLVTGGAKTRNPAESPDDPNLLLCERSGRQSVVRDELWAEAMRTMFWIYIALIVAGLLAALWIGLTS